MSHNITEDANSLLPSIMTGVYISFIKAGRVAVPLELKFLPPKAVDQDDRTDDKIQSSTKSVALKYFQETIDMLQPAVEAAIKYNSDVTETWKKYLGSPQTFFSDSTALGYIYQENKGKYTDVISQKSTCSEDDDEKDEGDEEESNDDCLSLRDLGGRFIKYLPTKLYIKACALIRSPLSSNKDDEKKIMKELGIRPSHSFFLPYNTSRNQESRSASSS